MEFYKWTGALYDTDQADSRANPLRRRRQLFLPQRTCSSCGDTAACYRRQYFCVRNPELKELHGHVELSDKEWDDFTTRFRYENGMAAEFKLYPGARVGIPLFELSAQRINDVMWPSEEVVVTRKLLDIMVDAGLTGFTSVKPELQWAARLRDKALPLPELAVLDIVGRAWRKGTSTEIECELCGRRRVVAPGGPIDEARWDGSDVFYVDLTDIDVGVSERARDVLVKHKITNFRLIPIEEMISAETMLAQVRARTFKFHPGIPLGY